MSTLSICIPRVDISVTKDYIFKVFCNLQIGYIRQIVEIPLRNDITGKRILIFLFWKRDSVFEQTLRSGQSVKVVHAFPQFWLCKANHKKPLATGTYSLSWRQPVELECPSKDEDIPK